MPKKCKAHHYILQSQEVDSKSPVGICKHCGHKKVHYNNQDTMLKKKRITRPGGKPQNVEGIVLSAGKERSPNFNPSSTEYNLKQSKGHFGNGFTS